MSVGAAIDDTTEVVYWRDRAERAEERLAEMQTRISELSEQVAVLSRILFGRSSERTGPGAGGEPREDGEDPRARDAQDLGDRGRRGQRPGSKGHGRRDYSGLENAEEIHDVPAGQRVCPECSREFEFLGSACNEQIDWRVKITRIVHRRLRYRRRCDCPGPRTVIAPVAPHPIRKGRFTAAFLARLLYQKYVLGLPVHRITRALAADGLDVAQGSVTGALKAVADLLVPVEEAIVARNAQAVHGHADETSWRVFEQTEGKERSPVVVVGAHRRGHGRVPDGPPPGSATVLERPFGIDRADAALAQGRRLLLSTDFYAAYQSLARIDGVDPLWCWAHIRRYFIRAAEAHEQLRYWRDAWVARIAELYLAHRAMATTEPATAEHTTAQAEFERALAALDTARHTQMRAPGLHPTAKKVLATLDREGESLARHRDFPDLDLDNNKSERALRTPVVGRKNYYGSHAEWSAHLAARVWTITATAERHHHEPLPYLTDYLNDCAASGGKAPRGQALHRYLPWIPDPTDRRIHDPPKIINPGASP